MNRVLFISTMYALCVFVLLFVSFLIGLSFEVKSENELSFYSETLLRISIGLFFMSLVYSVSGLFRLWDVLSDVFDKTEKDLEK